MSNQACWVLIEGEPFLSAAKAYREQKFAAQKFYAELARRYGADRFSPGANGLFFVNVKASEGWTKPRNRDGFSMPKKRHPVFAEFTAAIAHAPKMPSAYAVFGDAIHNDLNYENGDGWGGGAIGNFFFGPRIGWAGEFYFAAIPDARQAVAEKLARYPDAKILNGADTWSVPEGLREVPEAQIDLIVAQHKLALQKDAA